MGVPRWGRQAGSDAGARPGSHCGRKKLGAVMEFLCVYSDGIFICDFMCIVFNCVCILYTILYMYVMYRTRHSLLNHMYIYTGQQPEDIVLVDALFGWSLQN